MTEDERGRVVGYLKDCAWFNGGAGLLVYESQAHSLREAGIFGPFTVLSRIPETEVPE